MQHTAARRRLASEIARIHAEVTGGTADGVVVRFAPPGDDSVYVGGRPARLAAITAVIQGGRPVVTRQHLVRALAAMWSEVTGETSDSPRVTIIESDRVAGQAGRPAHPEE